MKKYTEEWAWGFLGKSGLPFFRTGSREMCNPAPTNTDVDFVVLDLNGDNNFVMGCKRIGFKNCGENEYEDDEFCAIRKGDVNLIIVESPYWFSQWQKATVKTKSLNILDKKLRVAAFERFYDGDLVGEIR